jgi:indole-3-glycerol phosphate synthase
VGINNRDLRTFEVSLDTTRTLLPLVPDAHITVAESGIKGGEDREAMAALGVSAILVGEGLIAADDIARATREMCGLNVESPEGTA